MESKPQLFNRSILTAACSGLVLIILLRLLCGPIYVVQDACQCGRTRSWVEFNESRALREIKFGRHINSTGNPAHVHLFSDPTWIAQY